MASNQADIDSARARALRGKKTSVDGLSHERPSLDEIDRHAARCSAEQASTTGKRQVLYQRMRSASGGDW